MASKGSAEIDRGPAERAPATAHDASPKAPAGDALLKSALAVWPYSAPATEQERPPCDHRNGGFDGTKGEAPESTDVPHEQLPPLSTDKVHRLRESTLEETLEAATVGLTQSLEAASVGYTRSAPRARRKERARNQKRVVRWVDLETSNDSAGGSSSTSKRSRSHEVHDERSNLDDVGIRPSAEQQEHRKQFAELVRTRSLQTLGRLCETRLCFG